MKYRKASSVVCIFMFVVGCASTGPKESRKSVNSTESSRTYTNSSVLNKPPRVRLTSSSFGEFLDFVGLRKENLGEFSDEPRASVCPIPTDRLDLPDALGRAMRGNSESNYIFSETARGFTCNFASIVGVEVRIGYLDYLPSLFKDRRQLAGFELWTRAEDVRVLALTKKNDVAISLLVDSTVLEMRDQDFRNALSAISRSFEDGWILAKPEAVVDEFCHSLGASNDDRWSEAFVVSQFIGKVPAVALAQAGATCNERYKSVSSIAPLSTSTNSVVSLGAPTECNTDYVSFNVDVEDATRFTLGVYVLIDNQRYGKTLAVGVGAGSTVRMRIAGPTTGTTCKAFIDFSVPLPEGSQIAESTIDNADIR